MENEKTIPEKKDSMNTTYYNKKPKKKVEVERDNKQGNDSQKEATYLDVKQGINSIITNENKIDKKINEDKREKKQKGKVIMVDRASVTVDPRNGNYILLRGNRGAKIGEIIEY